MIRKQNIYNVDICVHINIPMFVGHINLTFSLQSHFFPHDNPRNDINSSKELNEESFLKIKKIEHFIREDNFIEMSSSKLQFH